MPLSLSLSLSLSPSLSLSISVFMSVLTCMFMFMLMFFRLLTLLCATTKNPQNSPLLTRFARWCKFDQIMLIQLLLRRQKPILFPLKLKKRNRGSQAAKHYPSWSQVSTPCYILFNVGIHSFLRRIRCFQGTSPRDFYFWTFPSNTSPGPNRHEKKRFRTLMEMFDTSGCFPCQQYRKLKINTLFIIGYFYSCEMDAVGHWLII